MPALSHSKREQFAQAIASGQNLLQAYRSAGYSTVGSGWKANPYKLRHAADISGRVDELLQKRRHAEDIATERAIERLALTKEALARELVPLATSNLGDYIAFNRDSDPYFDLSKATREQMAAVQSLQFESYVDGKGAAAHEVKKLKLQLHPKIPAGMAIAQLFGWINREKPEPPTPLEQRLRAMTPDQRAEYAREFYRKVQQRLLEADATGEDEGGIGNVAINQEPE
jgi:hypothetical protein